MVFFTELENERKKKKKVVKREADRPVWINISIWATANLPLP